jgi:hypothetical protein
VVTVKQGEYTVAQIPPASLIIVNQKLAELLAIDVEIKTISIDELGTSINVTPEDLVPLEFITIE